MNGPALRRAGLVLALYVVAAWFVDDAAGWFRRALALPALFATLLRVGLWAGGPVAALLAWHYPSLGADRGESVDSQGGAAPDHPDA